MSSKKIAINPLPWILVEVGYQLSKEVLEQAMTALRPIGFDHLTVEIPEGMSVDAYREMLTIHDFHPAPGYFSGDFADPSQHMKLKEEIRTHAAAHSALGVDQSFIAHNLVEKRIAKPAIGFEDGSNDLSVIAEGLAMAAEVGLAEGVAYALHPHVGSPIEVESEIRAVLNKTAGSSLFFGPDTGHLAWAGVDIPAIFADYEERIIAVHLKDVDPLARTTSLAARDNYMTATNVQHVWTEPGRGMVDFDKVLQILPADFNGWFVIEVDVPNAATAEESSAISFAFVASHPYFSRD